MANPRLRILLVDAELYGRINIERNLSRLGYHRVAPLSCLRELLSVIDTALCVFDLLIINEAVFDSTSPELQSFVRTSPVIRHCLIYQGNELPLASWVDSSKSALDFSLSCPPDLTSIKHVMSFVDVSQDASRLEQEISEAVVGSVPWAIA